MKNVPGDPVVKISPFNARGQIRFLVRKPRSHMPQGHKNQNIKQKHHFKKFRKDFKNGPHQKDLKKNNKLQRYS